MNKVMSDKKPKRKQSSINALDRIPYPDLPKRRVLRHKERWRSVLWTIDSAEAQGHAALGGLAAALARVIQGDTLRWLIQDARPSMDPPVRIDDLFWDRDFPINDQGGTLSNLPVQVRRNRRIELSDGAVITRPWERWRLLRALASMGKRRAWGDFEQDHNHFAICWLPWPLIWSDNGHHSLTAGTIRGGGTVLCKETLDMTPVLNAVTTNGENWLRKDTGQPIARVRSIEAAALFVVGQRLIR